MAKNECERVGCDDYRHGKCHSDDGPDCKYHESKIARDIKVINQGMLGIIRKDMECLKAENASLKKVVDAAIKWKECVIGGGDLYDIVGEYQATRARHDANAVNNRPNHRKPKEGE